MSTTASTVPPTTDYFVMLDNLTGKLIMRVLGTPRAAETSQPGRKPA
jgi:hypothetical protein